VTQKKKKTKKTKKKKKKKKHTKKTKNTKQNKKWAIEKRLGQQAYTHKNWTKKNKDMIKSGEKKKDAFKSSSSKSQ